MSELYIKFHAENRYRTNHEAMSGDIGGIHSSGSEFFLNSIVKATWAKLNGLYFCKQCQCANNRNPFNVNVNVVPSVSGFLKFSKNLNFCSKFGRYSFSVNFSSLPR